MTGGGGLHRGRVTDRPGGAHWWRGRGPAGGGIHARGRARRGVLALVALVVLLLAGGVAAFHSLAGGASGPPAVAGPPPSPAVGPGSGGAGTAGAATDPAVLQRVLDEVTADAPLRFAPDATEPTARGAAGIDRLAAALRASPGPAVTVEGHSARVGDGGRRGLRLSQERAEEIAGRLEAAGVPVGRLRVVGVGPARPLATVEASRRVELRVG